MTDVMKDELWYKEGTDPLIADLRERLAMTEKALGLACVQVNRVTYFCPEDRRRADDRCNGFRNCLACWQQYFIEKAGE